MLSYRHAFHAGNHADVLKHWVYSLVLDYLNQKEKPYWVVDTHAGAGLFCLKDSFAQKNKEFESGFARLLEAKYLPPSLAHFKAQALCFSSQGEVTNKRLTHYPGSPLIAQSYLRAQDKLRLFELHPTDYQQLVAQFEPFKSRKQTQVIRQNGFEGVKACLPPPNKRGMVLIDPPYEVKQDYAQVVTCIKDCLKRFATGIYLLWYPLLARPEPGKMLDTLMGLSLENWLNVSIEVKASHDDNAGMFGSGLFIINPPWTLPAILQANMPVLTELLAQDDTASYALKYQLK